MCEAVTVVISPTMWFKSKAPVLGDFEQLVLLGVLRLERQDSAYGAAIRQEIHARSRRDVSINAVYTTLDRLESKGFLKSWVGDPTRGANPLPQGAEHGRSLPSRTAPAPVSQPPAITSPLLPYLA